MRSRFLFRIRCVVSRNGDVRSAETESDTRTHSRNRSDSDTEIVPIVPGGRLSPGSPPPRPFPKTFDVHSSDNNSTSVGSPHSSSPVSSETSREI